MFTLRTDVPPLDAKVIQPRLEELLEAGSNFLERQWPARYASVDQGRILFYTRTRVVRNTYESILWLSADRPKDPQRKLLVLATAPLVRTLFEELISLIFIFQDVARLVPAFVMTGYTEVWRERQHALKYYGDKEKWQEYLAALDLRLDELANVLQLTAKQKTSPTSRWPTPGKIAQAIKKLFPNSRDLPFVEFLNSWMYRSLSADSHLSYEGLLRRGSSLPRKTLRRDLARTSSRVSTSRTMKPTRWK